MIERAYIESLDNFLINLNLNNLKQLPKFKGFTSFYIFSIQYLVLESPRKELKFQITSIIKTSNLVEIKLQKWILDLTIKDSVSNIFNSFISRGTYLFSSIKNLNFFRCIQLRLKLKKYQEYITLSQLIVFPQLFDTTNISNITILIKDSSKFSVENFNIGTIEVNRVLKQQKNMD